MISQPVIGRSRTGDQLHLCRYLDYQQEGRRPFISSNASCNQRMKLRPLSTFRSDDKVTVKVRPGTLCQKCFGPNAVSREYFNATLVEA